MQADWKEEIETMFDELRAKEKVGTSLLTQALLKCYVPIFSWAAS